MRTFSLNDTSFGVKCKVKVSTDTGREWLGKYWLKVTDKKGSNRVNADIDHYAMVCEKNTMLSVLSGKEIPILDNDDVEEGYKFGISEAVLGFMESEFDSLQEMDKFKEDLRLLKSLSKEFVRAFHVNLLECMHSAVSGNGYATQILKEFVDRDKSGDIDINVAVGAALADIGVYTYEDDRSFSEIIKNFFRTPDLIHLLEGLR